MPGEFARRGGTSEQISRMQNADGRGRADGGNFVNKLPPLCLPRLLGHQMAATAATTISQMAAMAAALQSLNLAPIYNML